LCGTRWHDNITNEREDQLNELLEKNMAYPSRKGSAADAAIIN
jgi:hypothetical protein